VPVTVTSGIAGFVFPGDQVDLIVTYSIQDRPVPGQAPGTTGPLLEHKISETVLRNVRVIAIDQKLESKPGEATVAKTATFEVTPKESEIVALANEMGKLSLSLRSLVPGPDELKHQVSDSSVDSPTEAEAPDSPHAETYTVDSDISPLLHGPNNGPKQGGGSDSGSVTILRGGQSTATSVVQQQ
jgi:pilus assembly protein CpaB